MMFQLNPTIDVHTPLGPGTAFLIIDYGIDINTVWMIRFAGGHIRHVISDDIRVYGNPMYGKGWDIDIPNNWPKEFKNK